MLVTLPSKRLAIFPSCSNSSVNSPPPSSSNSSSTSELPESLSVFAKARKGSAVAETDGVSGVSSVLRAIRFLSESIPVNHDSSYCLNNKLAKLESSVKPSIFARVSPEYPKKVER